MAGEAALPRVRTLLHELRDGVAAATERRMMLEDLCRTLEADADVVAALDARAASARLTWYACIILTMGGWRPPALTCRRTRGPGTRSSKMW
jgi:hypothetical protein